MHQNVCASACCLIIRQCHGQFRIHNCKARSSIVIAVSSLDPAVFFCNNRRITHLTSCRCNSQYNTNRKTSCCLALFVIKIPYVPFIGNSISDCFCRINRTSAAYSKDEIYSFFFARARFLHIPVKVLGSVLHHQVLYSQSLLHSGKPLLYPIIRYV